MNNLINNNENNTTNQQTSTNPANPNVIRETLTVPTNQVEAPIVNNQNSNIPPVANPLPSANNLETGNTEVLPVMKEVVIDDIKKEGKVKYILVIILFILLFLIIIFLPEISNFISTYKETKEKEAIIIETGTLTCTKEEEDEKFNLLYKNKFKFTNNEMKSLEYTVEREGDPVKDREDLEKYDNDCKLIEDTIEETDFVTVDCSLDSGVNKVVQNFNYEIIDPTELNGLYGKIEQFYPMYELNQSIDEIEETLTKSGYTCERVK